MSEDDVQKMADYSRKWLADGFEKSKEIKIVKKRDWLDSPWKKFFKVSLIQLVQILY